jgi:hypothetical protein
MDHHTDPALGQSHVLGHGRVVDPLHGLHFEEVVARAQAADLRKPAFERPVADRGRVGSFQNAAVFAPLYVPCDAVTLCHREPGAVGQHLLQNAAVRQPPHTFGAHPAWYRDI